MKVCRLCERSGDFGNSHIIPEWVFVPFRDGTKPPQLVTDRPGVFPKRSPIGVYDQHLLCKSCERHFSEWDGYGKIALLDKWKEAEPRYVDSKIVAHRLPNVDIRKLRMFFISILWRASVSNRVFFQRISLGPFEAQAKARILSRQPGPLDEFSIVLAKWNKSWVEVFSDPYMTKIDGLNFSVIPMSNYMSYIKVDNRTIPSSLAPFVIGAEADIYILSRDFAQSKDRKVLENAARRFSK